MRDVSKIVLRGVVSDAPETREFGDGGKLVTLNVKTVTLESEEGGGMRERRAWHRVSVGGGRSVEIAERLAVDSPVYVEGRLRTRKYRNKEGEDAYATDVRCDILREMESAEPHVNRSLVLGALGQTPELRSFPSFKVMNISVATNESWTRRDGGTGEETEWHKVVVFDELAERLDGQLEKGQRVLVEGSVQNRKYTDRNGRERRMTETRAHSVVGSGRSPAGGGERSAAPSRERRQPADAWDEGGRQTGFHGRQQSADSYPTSGVANGDSDEDDVPF